MLKILHNLRACSLLFSFDEIDFPLALFSIGLKEGKWATSFSPVTYTNVAISFQILLTFSFNSLFSHWCKM